MRRVMRGETTHELTAGAMIAGSIFYLLLAGSRQSREAEESSALAPAY